jgi:hypothetical protein
MYISLQRYNISCKDCANFYEKFPLNKLKRFGGMEKNIYLCTVKNASEGLKRALNAKLSFLWIKHSITTELLRLTSRRR